MAPSVRSRSADLKPHHPTGLSSPRACLEAPARHATEIRTGPVRASRKAIAVPDDPAQEAPVLQCRPAQPGHQREHLLRGDPVRLEVVVLPAQLLITYWAANHTCGPERGYVMSA